MINRREILDIAGTFGLRPQIVEKDYVLGWVLAGIYHQAALAESWIFKGRRTKTEVVCDDQAVQV